MAVDHSKKLVIAVGETNRIERNNGPGDKQQLHVVKRKCHTTHTFRRPHPPRKATKLLRSRRAPPTETRTRYQTTEAVAESNWRCSTQQSAPKDTRQPQHKNKCPWHTKLNHTKNPGNNPGKQLLQQNHCPHPRQPNHFEKPPKRNHRKHKPVNEITPRFKNVIGRKRSQPHPEAQMTNGHPQTNAPKRPKTCHTETPTISSE